MIKLLNIIEKLQNMDIMVHVLIVCYQVPIMAKEGYTGALNVLKEGFEKYPDDNTVLESMIQIYIDLNKTDDAMKYLQIWPLKKILVNARYRFAQGTIV